VRMAILYVLILGAAEGSGHPALETTPAHNRRATDRVAPRSASTGKDS
jgi:hypothetical protein